MEYHIRDYFSFMTPALETGTERNATPAVLAAISSMDDGDTLCLDGLTLHFYPDGAYRMFYAISNNDAGEKAIAFPFIGRNHVTIDGGGARLIFHGRILPFVIDRSTDVTIRGLEIDYASPFYAQPRILESDASRVLLHFDSEECGCRVKNEHFCFYSRRDGWEHECDNALTLEFSALPAAWAKHPTHARAVPSAYQPPYFPYCGAPKDHGFLGGMFRDVTLCEVAPDKIEMRGNFGFVHSVGSYLVMTHATREYPGIFITDSASVLLSDIRLTYTSSMGVIAQTSEDLILDHVIAEVPEGSKRVLSVNADATHFVNCRGHITMKNCKFTNMMDDACNIHGIYGILRGVSDQNTLTIGFGHFQQEGVRFVREGDSIAVIDRRITKTICTLKITQSILISMTELCLKTEDTLPKDLCTLDFSTGDYLIENISTAPDVTISHCESGYNRPRGFLLSSAGKIVVEDCTFYNMNTSIQIGGEMVNWYESGAVEDVTIQNCQFDNAAYAGGIAISIGPHLVKMPETPFHGSITIENNRFVQNRPRILCAVSVGTLRYQNNTFQKDETLYAHPAYGENGITTEQCGTVICSCE